MSIQSWNVLEAFVPFLRDLINEKKSWSSLGDKPPQLRKKSRPLLFSQTFPCNTASYNQMVFCNNCNKIKNPLTSVTFKGNLIRRSRPGRPWAAPPSCAGRRPWSRGRLQLRRGLRGRCSRRRPWGTRRPPPRSPGSCRNFLVISRIIISLHWYSCNSRNVPDYPTKFSLQEKPDTKNIIMILISWLTRRNFLRVRTPPPRPVPRRLRHWLRRRRTSESAASPPPPAEALRRRPRGTQRRESLDASVK